MGPRKHVSHKKVMAVFDETARRNFLLGFNKRKKQRRLKAQRIKMKLEINSRRKVKQEKKELLNKKLDSYGLIPSNETSCSTSTSTHYKGMPQQSCSYEDHPNHVVVINTQPQVGHYTSPAVSSAKDIKI